MAKPRGVAAWLRANWWPFALIASVLPLLMMRASWAYTLWGDETYTLLVSEHSLRTMLKFTAYDAMPPFYYALMHVWLKVGRAFGLEGLLWARAITLMGWIATVMIGWFGSKPLIGRDGAALFVALLAINPQLTFSAVDLRNYSIAIPLLLTCFLSLLNLYGQRGENLSRWRANLLWVAYAIAAFLALWTHLFASFVLFNIGCLWIVLCIRIGNWRHPFVVRGFVANAFAVIGFLPWLVKVPGQLEFYSDLYVTWIPDPTLRNLLGVFTLWYPNGRMGFPAERWTTTAGLLTSLLTLAPMLAAAVRIAVTRGRRFNAMVQLASAGAAISLCYVLTLYLLTVWNVARVFDGVRYPILAISMWLFAVAASAKFATERLPHRTIWLWSLCVAWLWFVFSAAWTQHDIDAGKRRYRDRIAGISRLGHDEVIHTAVPELTPYIQGFFPGRKFIPVSELRDTAENRKGIHLLISSGWMKVQQPSRNVLHRRIEMRMLSRKDRLVPVDSGFQAPILDLHNLLGDLKLDKIRRLGSGEVLRADADFSKAAAVALGENQFAVDGFQEWEITSEMDLVRWTRQETVPLRFDRKLPAGDYVLKVKFFRQPYPTETATMTFRFEGDEAVESVAVPSGAQTIAIPIHANRAMEHPMILMSHPTWRPCDHMPGAQDVRRLGVYFSYAWLEKKTDGVK